MARDELDKENSKIFRESIEESFGELEDYRRQSSVIPFRENKAAFLSNLPSAFLKDLFLFIW